jgi:hypothetical protein
MCGSAPPAIAALLGRFLPRLGPLVATQVAFLFVCTPIGFTGSFGEREELRCRTRERARRSAEVRPDGREISN